MLDILFPLTGGDVDEQALPHVLAMAHLVRAEVHLVRVLEIRRYNDRPADPVEWHVKKSDAEAKMARLAAMLRAGGVVVTEVLLEGDPAGLLIDYVRQSGVDLVLLLAGQQRGGSGSVGGELLWSSYLTTLLLRPWSGAAPASEDGFRYGRVLVPLDGSKRAECVLPWVRLLAQHHGAEVILAHVVVEPELPRLMPASDEDLALARRLAERNREEATHYLEGVRARLGVRVEVRLLTGRKVATALHDLVSDEGVDLVVLSAHGYGGEARWPHGGVATSFIDHGRTPLLLVQDLAKHTFVAESLSYSEGAVL